jgi:hypothetical protein
MMGYLYPLFYAQDFLVGQIGLLWNSATTSSGWWSPLSPAFYLSPSHGLSLIFIPNCPAASSLKFFKGKHETSSSRSSRSEEGNEDEEDKPRQPRFWSLNDIYNTTGEVCLVCLLAYVENITFEEASQDKKMEEGDGWGDQCHRKEWDLGTSWVA